MKSDEEIAREMRRLEYSREHLRARYSRFGDDHQRAITAQIQVLENRMTLDQVHAMYGGAGNEYNEYELVEASYAHDWMRNLLEEDSPPCSSIGWLSLVDMRFHAGLPA